MKTKESLLNYFEDNLDYFLEKLFENHKHIAISGDIDNNTVAFVISKKEFKHLTNQNPVSLSFYKKYRCGCEYDCCGCMSYQAIDVISNGIGYVTIIVGTSYNY